MPNVTHLINEFIATHSMPARHAVVRCVNRIHTIMGNSMNTINFGTTVKCCELLLNRTA